MVEIEIEIGIELGIELELELEGGGDERNGANLRLKNRLRPAARHHRSRRTAGRS